MKGSRRHHRALALLPLAGGALLFVAIVRAAGPAEVAERVAAFGPGFAVLLAVSGARHLARTLAWALCLRAWGGGVKLRHLLAMHIAGEALTELTLAGPLLGGAAKAALLARRVPTERAVASVLAENLLYALAALPVIAGGSAVLVAAAVLPDEARVLGLGAGAAAALAAAGAFLQLHVEARPARRLFAMLEGRRVPARLARWREALVGTEERVLGLYRANPRLFFGTLALELTTSAAGVAEAYVVLTVVAGRATLLGAFLAEATYRAVNAAFAFLPLVVGVDEGSASLVLRAVGYGAADGLSLAIIRKVRTLVWIAVGAGLFALASAREPIGRAALAPHGAPEPGGENA